MFSPAAGRGWRGHRTDPRPGPPEGPLQRGFEPNWPVPEEEARGGGEGDSEAWAVSGSLMQAAVGAAQVWCLGCLLLRQKPRSRGGPLPVISHPHSLNSA